MIIIGSYAIFQWLPYDREIGDIDLLCTREEFSEIIKHTHDNHEIEKLQIKESGAMIKAKDCLHLEVQFYGEGQFKCSNLMIENITSSSNFTYRKIPYYKNNIKCIDLGIYYLMKETHKYRKNSPHFMKTMQDNCFLKTIKDIDGLKVKFKEFYDTRYKETYDYNHPNLNQNKQEFFTDEIPYVFDHDTDLHEAVKHLDKPAYRYYMQAGAEVMCDKEKFSNLSEFVRLLGVLEESYVLALERSVIPYCTDPKKAFDIALEKVCTSITSGWFREFAWNNYYKVQSMYHESYVEKFKNHVIKLHGEEYVQNKSKLFRS